MYGIIYEAINKVNNKRYIGQTTENLSIRKSGHRSGSHKGTNLFSKAIRKYGWDNFEWHIIDYANNIKELDSKEIFWILFFNTYKQGGYNMTTGGQMSKEEVWRKYCREDSTNFARNKRFMVFDKQGNYIKTTNNIIMFAEEIGALYPNVGLVLRGKKNSVGDYLLFYEDKFTPEKLNRHIKQLRNTNEFAIFDYKTGNCLGIWTNFSKCQDETGFSRRMMERQLINGLKTHARKFIIKYLIDCNENDLAKIEEFKVNSLAS